MNTCSKARVNNFEISRLPDEFHRDSARRSNRDCCLLIDTRMFLEPYVTGGYREVSKQLLGLPTSPTESKSFRCINFSIYLCLKFEIRDHSKFTENRHFDVRFNSPKF